MARSKRKRGYRPITVNGTQYRWYLNAYEPDSYLRITHAEIKGQTVVVTMVGWVNFWYGMNNFQVVGDAIYISSDAVGNEPYVVSSKFVRECILFALEHGWTPLTPAKDFSITSINGELSLSE